MIGENDKDTLVPSEAEDFVIEYTEVDLIPDEEKLESQKTVDDPDSEQESVELDDEDEEVTNYGKRAQKRIRRLVAENKELRAANVQASSDNMHLVERVKTSDTKSRDDEIRILDTEDKRLEAQLANLKASHREAMEAGDQDALFEANQKTAQITSQQTQVQAYKAHLKTQVGNEEQGYDTQGGAENVRPPIQPDPRAERWRRVNPWFVQDPAMHLAARHVIHAQLINEGYNPVDGGDEEVGQEAYYREGDKRIREEFPHKFKSTPKGRRTQTVAGGTRGGSNKRVVKLTQRERDLASRLGVSEKSYALEKLKKIQVEAS